VPVRCRRSGRGLDRERVSQLHPRLERVAVAITRAASMSAQVLAEAPTIVADLEERGGFRLGLSAVGVVTSALRPTASEGLEPGQHAAPRASPARRCAS